MSEISDVPSGPDLERPNAARMYDYNLGGSANFAVDREAADKLLDQVPDGLHYIRHNRAFLARAVGYLAGQAGIDQFLDLGSGIPTVGNVHEIAQGINPHSRIAYVDVEPVAAAHARRLLAEHERVTVTEADLRDPHTVLTAPGVAGLLDFTRPIAVLTIGVLPFLLDDTEARHLMATYRDATVPGSYAAISHLSAMSWDPAQLAAGLEVMDSTTTPERARTRDEIRALLPGYTLVDPGLVPTAQWRPDQEPDAEEIHRSNCYAAVGFHDGATG